MAVWPAITVVRCTFARPTLWWVALLAIWIGGGILGGSCSTAAAAEAVVTPRPVALITPGTVIADRAPQGWSHLIIKSQPRVGARSADKVSQGTAQLSQLLFTAIVADVQLNPDRRQLSPYFLSNVSVGLGTQVGGRNMVVSSNTQEKLGANLGFIARSVLSGGEKKLGRMRCVARSRTMAIVDAFGVLAAGGKHHLVVLRYAILVHPASGRLDTILWVLQPNAAGQYVGPLGIACRLPPNKIDDCVLRVDPDEFTFGVPGEKAFAMEQIPQGQAMPAFSGRLKTLAATPQFTPASAVELEGTLRKLLHKPLDGKSDRPRDGKGSEIPR